MGRRRLIDTDTYCQLRSSTRRETGRRDGDWASLQRCGATSIDIDFHFHLVLDLRTSERAMSERLIDIRTELASSPSARVEVGRDGVLHVLAGPVTLHMDRATCEELTTTLARAMIALARTTAEQQHRAPRLRLLRDVEQAPASAEPAEPPALPR